MNSLYLLRDSDRDRSMLANVTRGRDKRALVFAFDEHVDEALWSAYERHDKRAVTKTLFHRYLRRRKSEAWDKVSRG